MHETSHRHALVLVRYCAEPTGRASSHPVASPQSSSSHRVVRPCYLRLPRAVPRQDRADGARSRPRGAIADPASVFTDRRQQPLHTRAAFLQAMRATCGCCRRPHRQQPRHTPFLLPERGQSSSAPVSVCLNSNARDRPPTLREDITRDQRMSHPDCWHSEEIRRLGCFQYVLQRRCTDA